MMGFVPFKVLLRFGLFLFFVNCFELFEELVVSICLSVHAVFLLFLLVSNLLSLLQDIFTDFPQISYVLFDSLTFISF